MKLRNIFIKSINNSKKGFAGLMVLLVVVLLVLAGVMYATKQG